MKLCRFELLAHPGEVRSGLVYSGKIYETDGAQPIAIHEAADVRPLTPVGQPPSLRIFDFTHQEGEEPLYTYGNPASLVPASQIVPIPHFAASIDYEPYFAAVIGQAGHDVLLDQADGIVLGYSLFNVFVSRDAERAEVRLKTGYGRSRDFAIAFGPVLTTPEELDDAIAGETGGRRYKLQVVTRVNGVDRRRGDLLELRYTMAQAISAASQSAPVRPGDVLAIGPLVGREDGFALSAGDEVQLAVERLGAIATKIE